MNAKTVRTWIYRAGARPPLRQNRGGFGVCCAFRKIPSLCFGICARISEGIIVVFAYIRHCQFLYLERPCSDCIVEVGLVVIVGVDLYRGSESSHIWTVSGQPTLICWGHRLPCGPEWLCEMFSARGIFDSQCFGERHFCLTEFRWQAVSPHSVLATAVSPQKSFGDWLSPHSVLARGTFASSARGSMTSHFMILVDFTLQQT